jgi:hypothetical protein
MLQVKLAFLYNIIATFVGVFFRKVVFPTVPTSVSVTGATGFTTTTPAHNVAPITSDDFAVEVG